MPVLFISHSSRDDAQADALAAWLNNHGFTDIFSDHDSIVGGDKWREALRASANACRVVIFLVTADWLASSKCFGEFEASWLMGKRLIPLFLLPGRDTLDEEARKRLATVKGEDQGLDIAPCVAPDGTFDLGHDSDVAERLKIGCARPALQRVNRKFSVKKTSVGKRARRAPVQEAAKLNKKSRLLQEGRSVRFEFARVTFRASPGVLARYR